ncbi:hypothetical protein ACIBCT_21070 [Streptosporangium sp. NPDC050855]|uniref:phage tail tube protein n=1 Tax=Streptosporangium sp. NPDC050855 TaxID=3366194 RepID=UPI0037B65ACA
MGDGSVRAYFVPRVSDPEAPTVEELAAGTFLGVVVDDGLQFTRDESADRVQVLAHEGRRYRVIRHLDGSVDVFYEGTI